MSDPKNDYLWDGSGEPDEGIKALEDALSAAAYAGEPVSLPTRRWPLTAGVALAAAAVLAVAVAPIWMPNEVVPVAEAGGWPMSSEQGCPDADCVLSVGEWLETGHDASAKLEVADIGVMEVAPGSRLRLKNTGPQEHRLELAKGSIHAKVIAPPRLLIVETPSADAVDLGCAYDLTVADNGNSLLEVSSGWVALEVPQREVIVPAGARAETIAGRGPLTPYFPDATAGFRGGLAAIDFDQRDADSLDVVLLEARKQDTLSLWHLLPVVDAPDRERIYERIIELDTQLMDDPTFTKAEVLALDERAMRALMSEIQFLWFIR